MADQQQIERLRANMNDWNKRREQQPEEAINLSEADLSSTDLIDADLLGANLSEANLSEADLRIADLSGADLSGADLSGADLSGADLSGANLSEAYLNCANLSEADFRDADLSGADLSGADLGSANLSSTNLSGANFSGTDLRGANLNIANLRGANFSGATIGWTTFGELDLRGAKGLETIQHKGPSILSINTIYLSEGDIPEVFVRGTGAPDSFVEYMYTLASKPIQYYTCFISYSSKNQDFAERIYADLQSKGVRCWYAPEDIKIGDHFAERIEHAIRTYDKLLVILSQHSVHSSWVEDEVRAAQEKEERFKREQTLNKTVLFPVKIDGAIDEVPIQWAARLRRQRHISDFIHWKDHDSYQKALKRLLRDLKADAEQQES